MKDDKQPVYKCCYSDADGYHIRENDRPMTTIADIDTMKNALNQLSSRDAEIAELKTINAQFRHQLVLDAKNYSSLTSELSEAVKLLEELEQKDIDDKCWVPFDTAVKISAFLSKTP